MQVKNDRLDTVEELGLIKGYQPEIVAKLRSCVTVYGSGPGQPAALININTAPKELLAALDDRLMGESVVQDILEYRKTKAIKDISEIPRLDAAVATGLRGKISYAGDIFRIHSEAKVGESVSVVEAVVRVSGAQQAVLYWREY